MKNTINTLIVVCIFVYSFAACDGERHSYRHAYAIGEMIEGIKRDDVYLSVTEWVDREFSGNKLQEKKINNLCGGITRSCVTDMEFDWDNMGLHKEETNVGLIETEEEGLVAVIIRWGPWTGLLVSVDSKYNENSLQAITVYRRGRISVIDGGRD